MFVLPLSRYSAPARRESLVDRLFDDSFDRYFGGARNSPSARTPAMDVAETDDAFTVTFEVPGVSREQLKVSVEGRRVVLTTTAPEAAAAGGREAGDPPATNATKPVERMLYSERIAAVYARTVSLPAEVDQAASEAKFDGGVLTLVLAKKSPAGATQLSIA